MHEKRKFTHTNARKKNLKKKHSTFAEEYFDSGFSPFLTLIRCHTGQFVFPFQNQAQNIHFSDLVDFNAQLQTDTVAFAKNYSIIPVKRYQLNVSKMDILTQE